MSIQPHFTHFRGIKKWIIPLRINHLFNLHPYVVTILFQSKLKKKKKEISCQTDPCDFEDNIFLFESNFMGHNAQGMFDVTTQCNLADKKKLFPCHKIFKN